MLVPLLQSSHRVLCTILLSLCIFMLCFQSQCWAKKGLVESSKLPNLYDTLRVMKHTQGIDQALLYIDSLSLAELKTLKGEQLFRSLEKVACFTPQGSMISAKELKRALMSIKQLSRLSEVRTCLIDRWLTGYKPKSMSGGEAETVIARAVSLASRQAGRVDLLVNVTQHPDPEVREHAAYAGADPSHLCDLLKDPWDNVKRGAIRGLEKIAGPQGLCLRDALKDLPISLKGVALKALGHLGKSAWAKKRGLSSSLAQALTEIVHANHLTIHIRHRALVALASWGSLSVARDILSSHLKTARLEGLAMGALQALIVGSPNTALQDLHNVFLKSSSIRVRLASLDLMVRLKLPDQKQQERLEHKKYILIKTMISEQNRDENPLLLKRLLKIRTQLISNNINFESLQ